MTQSVRARRVADQLRAILSDLLLREMADPRLRHVTITEVKLSRDLRIADIYHSRYSGGPEERKESAKALEGAKTFLRHEVGTRLGLRYVPELRFHEDRSVDHALHIDEVLSQLGRVDDDDQEPS